VEGVIELQRRTMHSSLMLRMGARPEVTRDNMGHANNDVTQNVYSWWEERVEAYRGGSFPRQIGVA
jgi:integrase